MKHLPILLIILTATLASCKKEPQGALSGKWQETKLVLYQDSANVVLYDTTYLQPFTNYDYIQFNSNSTCTIGNDHYYYVNSPGSPKVPQAFTPVSSTSNYSAYGTVYIVNTTGGIANPGGFVSADTLSVSGNTILLHSVFYAHVPGFVSITDSYYTRE